MDFPAPGGPVTPDHVRAAALRVELAQRVAPLRPLVFEQTDQARAALAHVPGEHAVG